MSYGTEKLTLEQATELTAQLESDARGLINYEEYVNVSHSRVITPVRKTKFITFFDAMLFLRHK